MTTPRSNVVRLRLTDLEKKDWQEAAGGARRLSEWLRSVANRAAAEARGQTSIPVPNEKPLIVEAAIAASHGGEEDGCEGLSESSSSSSVTQPSASAELPSPVSSEQCPRWMHHRPNTYCGSCKKLIVKR